MRTIKFRAWHKGYLINDQHYDIKRPLTDYNEIKVLGNVLEHPHLLK